MVTRPATALSGRGVAALACAGHLACLEGPGVSLDATTEPADCASAAALRVSPARVALDAGDGREAAVRFRAVGLLADGRDVAVAPEWSLSPVEAGVIDETGLVVASGRYGGRARVSARLPNGEVAHAEVEMKTLLRVPADVSPEHVARFAEEVPRDEWTAPPVFRSPADGDRLAAGPVAPTFAWRGAGHSLFRLRLLSDTVDVSVFTGQESWTPDDATWRALADSNRGTPVVALLEAADENAGVVHWDGRAPRLFFCSAVDRCDGRDDDCDGAVDGGCEPPPAQSTATPADSCARVAEEA